MEYLKEIFKEVNDDVEEATKNLVEKISKKLDYFSGIYKCNNRYSGFFSKSKDRKVFFNLQINGEDLNLECLFLTKLSF